LLQRQARGPRVGVVTSTRAGAAALRDPADLALVVGLPLSDEQLAAITAPLAPLVVIAGAGSGKTTVMAARVVWLVGTGAVRADEVLGLTFTNKAAAELGERVRAALRRLGWGGPEIEEEIGEPEIATYHAYAGRLIAEHGLRVGVEPNARLLADAGRYQLAARVIREAEGPLRALQRTVPTLVGELLGLESECREHLVDLDVLREFDHDLIRRLQPATSSPTSRVGLAIDAARRRLELADLVAAYRRAKNDRDLVDFGDQMAIAARVAEHCPEVGQLERERHRVVLLDEYQDTSVAQRRMLVGLFGAGHPVTAVGDPCQAIYGWRGASVANLEEFPRHFPPPSADDAQSRAPRLTLRQNRRNGARILGAANALSQPLRAIHAGVSELLPAPGGAGEVRTAVLTTWAEELAWVGDEVCAALADGIAAHQIAVLVRATRDIGPLHAELTKRQIPVEVVGLGGLVHLPEVAELIAVLEVLDSPVANAALVRLLTGPRWRIGVRDLALLGRRAAELISVPGPEAGDRLRAALPVTDPAERVSLSEALARPGELPYSAAARARFAQLGAELRELRGHLGRPLLDVLHLIVTRTGLDTEIAAGPAAARRQECLAAFLDIAADFTDLDGETSVTAFLAYLRAAAEHDRGLDAAGPGPAESVKLMTAHKAKGLEWDVVLLPDLTETVFPAARGRARWTTTHGCLPFPLRGDRESLPGVGDWSPAGLAGFEADLREHSELEERRLAYVATTRPRRRLVASSHWWGATQKRPRGPSAYLRELRAFTDRLGCNPGGPWAPGPPAGAVNPTLTRAAELGWPAPLDAAAAAGRRDAAELVRRAMRRPGRPLAATLSPAEAARVSGWDHDLTLLRAEQRIRATRERIVPLPTSLTASQVVQLATDPAGLARELARPMPRQPQPAARRGSRFHAWLASRFGQQVLLEPDEIPGAGDTTREADVELKVLQDAFARGEFADKVPLIVEAPFALSLGGRVVRGRIDAVYETLDGFEVIDWKTSGRERADALQLALYRLAWAEIAGVPPDDVTAAFHYVRSGRTVRPVLVGRAGVEGLLNGAAAADPSAT